MLAARTQVAADAAQAAEVAEARAKREAFIKDLGIHPDFDVNRSPNPLFGRPRLAPSFIWQAAPRPILCLAGRASPHPHP